MNLDIIEIAAYISLGLLLYTFLLELSKPKKGAQKWMTWIFILFIGLIIGYFIWLYFKNQDKKKNEKKDGITMDLDDEEAGDSDILESESEPEKIVEFTQEDYKPELKDFVLVDGASFEGGQIKYEDFKLWYLTPEFLQKYTNAIKQGFRLKKHRLMEVKRQFMADLRALKKEDKPKDALSGLLSKLDRNEDTKMLESTINEINSLLKEIKKRETSLSLDNTRKGLIMALTDRNNGIDSLVGRNEIKNELVAKLYAFSQNPRIFLSNFQNMAIYGPSGVGKTKLAKVIGHVYSKCGILIRDHVHIVTKQSLTTAYVNESAKMTRRLLLANLESIVFIDEAYDLTPPPTILGNGLDHGYEAITEIVNFIDKLKGLSIIIVAGYKNQMEERFMKANEGLPRRFPHILTLKPYNSKELTDILIKFLLSNSPDLKFNQKHGNYLFTIVNYLNKENPKLFETQAGSMENLANAIATATYSSPGRQWSKDYEEITLSGVNTYLAQNNISLEMLE